MAAQQQGTGQHKHKSAEEPFPHHEAASTSGKETTHSGSNSGQHASGKSIGGSKASSSEESGKRSSSGSGESDLRSREYTGPDGEQHHHTKTYVEQHKNGK